MVVRALVWWSIRGFNSGIGVGGVEKMKVIVLTRITMLLMSNAGFEVTSLVRYCKLIILQSGCQTMVFCEIAWL